jgi:Fuc2NAc and GlcNAc transferase
MPHELLLLLVTVTSVGAAAMWLAMARWRRWVDHPNDRSSHQTPTPSSGGVAIVVAFAVFAVIDGSLLQEWQGALAATAAMVLAMTGITDDFLRLSIRVRVMLQVLAIAALWPMLIAMPAWPVPGGMSLSGVALALALACSLFWLINLYNFMDGIDGMAAMEAIFAGLALSVLTILKGYPLNDLSPLALVAAMAGFLAFNLAPARLFMGDIGSYFTGFTLAVIGMRQIQAGIITYWTLGILLGVFIVDSTTTLLGRLMTGAVWYHPHRSHAYQLLARRWSGHGRVVLLYTGVNVVWLLPLAWLAEQYPDQGFLLLLVAWLPLVAAVRWIRHALMSG